MKFTPVFRKAKNAVSRKKLFTALGSALLALLLIAAARTFMDNLGEPPSKHHLAELAIALSIFCPYRKTFWPLVLPATVLSSVYGPAGRMYGPPDFQALAALLATTSDESLEFLGLIPAKLYLLSALPPALLTAAHFLSKKLGIEPWRNRAYLFAAFAALVFCAGPISYFSSLKAAVRGVEAQSDAIRKYGDAPAWGKSVYSGKPNADYVLVIGESAQRDYFSLYGYPVANTPFLSSSPHVTAVDGLSSADTHTIGSLRLMLTKPGVENWSADYSRTFVDLAKSAGIQTVWISNQGLWGTYDTPVSAIGRRADRAVFPNQRGYSYANASDFRLLGLLKAELDKPARTPRLFVLHMLGSHPDVCMRVEDVADPYRVTDPARSNLACYATSVLKTDRFLESLYGLMEENSRAAGRTFSIVYFSDHGIAASKQADGSVKMLHAPANQGSYRVPLVMLSPDTRARRVLRSEKSPLRFTDGLGAWMHIGNPGLTPEDLFDGKSARDDFGLAKRVSSLPPNPGAEDITPILVPRE